MLSPGTYSLLQRRCASSLRLRSMERKGRQRSCPHHLYHEQRVAFCLLIERVDHGWIKLGAHDMLSQGGRLGGRERPEGNLRHQAISLQCTEERQQGMPGQGLL